LSYCKGQIELFFIFLARPEAEAKTLLGKRLRDVRRALGDPIRDDFGKKFNLSRDAIALYERGEREPNTQVLLTYKTLYSVNLHWLLTGEGEMFTDTAAVPANQRAVDVDVMARIAARVEKTFEQLKRVPAETQVTTITAQIYNDLLTQNIDFADEEELEPAIAVQITKLKKRMLDEPDNLSTAVA